MIRDLLFYGAGVPRFVFIWLLVTPAMIWLARAAGLRGRRLALLVATTLPTFGLHSAAVPGLTSFPVQWAITTLSLGALATMLLRVVTHGLPPVGPCTSTWLQRRVSYLPALTTVVLLGVVLRAVWTWIDPGIADIPQASEFAARQVLAGLNPYVEPNPFTYTPVYQYTAGTISWHLPFVAAIPDGRVMGETFMAARLSAWAMDALAMAAIGIAGWLAVGRPERVPVICLVPAALYALNATMIREVGLTAANDVLMAVLSAIAVGLLSTGRNRRSAAACWGLAVSVKLPALALAPIFVAVAGIRPVLLAGCTALALQTPFFLWPTVGLHGLDAILEPALRNDSYDVVRRSVWWPLYGLLAAQGRLASVLSYVPLSVGTSIAVLGVRSLTNGRRGRRAVQEGERLLALAALTLTSLVLLAPGWRNNFQSWPLPLAVLVAASGIWTTQEPTSQPPLDEKAIA